MKKSGTGPAETGIGTRVSIAKDTAVAWLKAQEKPLRRRSLIITCRELAAELDRNRKGIVE